MTHYNRNVHGSGHTDGHAHVQLCYQLCTCYWTLCASRVHVVAYVI